MNRTRIFVSSTFFDLEQVREDIRTTIASLGHEPLLNEYSSFPVNPDLDTIENCKKVVRSSDLFVLIVGGRRGSLDPASGKSITNVEYDAAKVQGISCFVFVNKALLTLLPVWSKNPDADFTPAVDDPKVFGFIQQLQSEQRWIFSFSKASEISDVIRTQLSVFLQTLLNQKRSGRLDPLREFDGETEKARIIAMERPRFWEFLLTAELLRTKLSILKQDYIDFENGLMFQPKKHVAALEYIQLLGAKMSDPTELGEIVKRLVEGELIASWGPPGKPGDPVQILRAVNKINDTCRKLLEWELEISALEPPKALNGLGSTLRGMTLEMINELARIPNEIETALQGTWSGIKEVSINLVFQAPPQIARFLAEMEEVKKHPEWLLP